MAGGWTVFSRVALLRIAQIVAWAAVVWGGFNQGSHRELGWGSVESPVCLCVGPGLLMAPSLNAKSDIPRSRRWQLPGQLKLLPTTGTVSLPTLQ